jgi:hypothetical protein
LEEIRKIDYYYSYGAAAQRGLWPPHSRGFRDHTHDAPQSVGLLWTVISPSQRPLPDNTQQTDIHAPGGIFLSRLFLKKQFT